MKTIVAVGPDNDTIYLSRVAESGVVVKNIETAFERLELKREIEEDVDRIDLLKLVLTAHGSPDGLMQFEKMTRFLPPQLSHAMDFLPLKTKAKIICEIFSCSVGSTIKIADSSEEISDNMSRYSVLPENIIVIIHSGRFTIKSVAANKHIKETLLERNAARIFLDGIIYRPETMKMVAKREILEIYKYSAPKPKSSDDLSSKSIKSFLEREVDRFLSFYNEKIEAVAYASLALEYKEMLTDDLIKKYKKDAFEVELGRLMSEKDEDEESAEFSSRYYYVKHYLLSENALELLDSLLLFKDAAIYTGKKSPGFFVISELIRLGYGKEVDEIMRSHPDPNYKLFNNSLFGIAIEMGAFDMARAMLEKKLKSSSSFDEGFNHIYLALQQSIEPEEREKCLNMAEILIRFGNSFLGRKLSDVVKLEEACFYGLTALVEVILKEEKFDIESIEKSIEIAKEKGQIKIEEYLNAAKLLMLEPEIRFSIKAFAAFDQIVEDVKFEKSWPGELLNFCKIGNYEGVKAILDRKIFDTYGLMTRFIQIKDEEGRGLLKIAQEKGYEDIARILSLAEFVANNKSEQYDFDLKGCEIEDVGLLKQRDDDYAMSLLRSCIEGDYEKVKEIVAIKLLKKDITKFLTIKDESGRSLVDIAHENGYGDIIKTLLGAELFLKIKNPPIENHELYLEEIKSLVSRGAEIYEGLPSLILAKALRNYEIPVFSKILGFFLKKGYSFKGFGGYSLLRSAISTEYAMGVEVPETLFIEAIFENSIVEQDDLNKALIAAIINKNKKITKILLSKKADINYFDKTLGISPLTAAVSTGDKVFIEILLEYEKSSRNKIDDDSFFGAIEKAILKKENSLAIKLAIISIERNCNIDQPYSTFRIRNMVLKDAYEILEKDKRDLLVSLQKINNFDKILLPKLVEQNSYVAIGSLLSHRNSIKLSNEIDYGIIRELSKNPEIIKIVIMKAHQNRNMNGYDFLLGKLFQYSMPTNQSEACELFILLHKNPDQLGVERLDKIILQNLIEKEDYDMIALFLKSGVKKEDKLLDELAKDRDIISKVVDYANRNEVNCCIPLIEDLMFNTPDTYINLEDCKKVIAMLYKKGLKDSGFTRRVEGSLHVFESDDCSNDELEEEIEFKPLTNIYNPIVLELSSRSL
jgi:ankyrin repeat protein